MGKIKMWADLDSTGLINSDGESLSINECGLSTETSEKLQQWVNDYDYVISKEEDERLAIIGEIEVLDKRGLIIFDLITSGWIKNNPFKNLYTEFEYMSEGKLKVLKEVVIKKVLTPL